MTDENWLQPHFGCNLSVELDPFVELVIDFAGSESDSHKFFVHHQQHQSYEFASAVLLSRVESRLFQSCGRTFRH